MVQYNNASLKPQKTEMMSNLQPECEDSSIDFWEIQQILKISRKLAEKSLFKKDNTEANRKKVKRAIPALSKLKEGPEPAEKPG